MCFSLVMNVSALKFQFLHSDFFLSFLEGFLHVVVNRQHLGVRQFLGSLLGTQRL
jgi:hypothetical protein